MLFVLRYWFLYPRVPSVLELSHLGGSLPPYKYTRLSNSRAIRLITLKPGNDDETSPIACRMEEVTLDSAPPFTALSYAWDSQDGTDQIDCDGAVITVTKNCIAALRYIRQCHRDARIWVDAICIEQKDDEEKSHQIGIMGDVYKTAAEVQVWLGEQDDSSSLVCKFFAEVSGASERNNRFINRNNNQSAKEIALDIARRWPQLGKSLADFFARSWFTRAWPVQEITLPHHDKVTLVCGDKHLKLAYIRHGWNFLKELAVFPDTLNLDQALALQFYLADAIALKRGLDPATGYNGLNFGEPLLKDLSEFSFTSVMNSMRSKACSLPKDKFFSLYGVFQELEVEHNIPIDTWKKNDVQVFKEVALACLKLDRKLDAIRLARTPDPYQRLSYGRRLPARHNPYNSLSASIFAMTGRVLRVVVNLGAGRRACYSESAECLNELPSWAPDWTQPAPAQLFPAHHISLLSKWSPSPSHLSLERMFYDIDGLHLKVEAKIIGHVTKIGTVGSTQLLCQILEDTLHPLPEPGATTLDPVMSATMETAVNLIWRSLMAELFVSMRMAIRTMHIFDIWAYIAAASTFKHFRTRIHELLCKRFPSVASCPTDGYRMQLKPGWSPMYYTEYSAVSQAFVVFVRGKNRINSDIWHQASADVLLTLGGVLWEFRISLIETLFQRKYDDIDWIAAQLVLGYLISVAGQFLAVTMGNTTNFLVAWSLGVLVNAAFIVALVVWTWKILVPLVVLVVILRIYRDKGVFLSSPLKIASFRQPGEYTHGTHFFLTETGIAGSAIGAVRSQDCLALIRGSTDYVVLRAVNNDYTVIGASYVGTPSRADQVLAESSWTSIRLC